MISLQSYIVAEELDTPENLEWKVNNWLDKSTDDEKTTWNLLVNNYSKMNIDDFRDALNKYKVDPKSLVDVCCDNVDGSQENLDYVYIMQKICNTIADMHRGEN